MSQNPDDLLSPQLIERLYQKLKPLAARVQWVGDPAMHPTSLVHQAYLKLIRAKNLETKPDPEVIRIFAHVMRQIMLDAARRRQALKRGGGVLVPLIMDDEHGGEPGAPAEAVSPEDVLTLEAAMKQLESADKRKAAIIDCRFYLGMTLAETAQALSISKKTVERDELSAKDFLAAQMRPYRNEDQNGAGQARPA